MKTVAVICFENPFNKPSDGAKNDMKTRIIALAKLEDCIVDIYAFNKVEEEDAVVDCVKYGIRNFYQFSVEKTTLRRIISRYPLSVCKRYSETCVEEMKKHEYDMVIYEGEHTFLYRMNNDIKAKKHILRQHDIESTYRHELSKSAKGLLRKLAQELESIKYRKLENGLDTYFDSILFISKSEKEEFDKKYKGTICKFVFMPPSALNFAESAVLGEKEHRILYVGNLELQNNFLSMLWYVKNVFPIIKKSVSDVKLRIIGKIEDEDKKKLLENTSNVDVLGYVEDLNQEIKEASIIAVPVLYGAGVKVKVIDALSYGQIVCATNKTIEGTELVDGVHLIACDKSNELATICIDVLKNRAEYEHLAKDGLNFVKKYHSINYQESILRKVISD